MIRPQYASLSLRRAWIEIRIPANQPPQVAGRSPYGERGLKCASRPHSPGTRSRSPYGERGLKYREFPATPRSQWSLSLRRAWIEMATSSRAGVIRSSRSPYGERGLKFDGDLNELAGGAGR